MGLQRGGVEADEVQRGDDGQHVVDDAAVADEGEQAGIFA